MIDFKLQRFAGGANIGSEETQKETITGPRWYAINTGGGPPGYGAVGGAFLPEGATAQAVPDTTYDVDQLTGIENWDDLPEAFTIRIHGAYPSVIDQTDAANVTVALARMVEIENIEVTGEGAGGLTLTLDGTKYRVGEDGKLVEAAEILSTSVVNKTKRADGKIVSKTLNFINPAASDKDISKFMAALNSLSKNETIKGGLVVVEKRVL